MNQTILLITVVALLSLLGVLFAVYVSYTRQQAMVWKNRLHSGTSQGSFADDEDLASSPSSSGRVLEFINSIGLAAKPQKESELSDIRTRLVVAGYRNPNAPILFWGSRLLSCGIFIFGSLLISVDGRTNIDPVQLRLLLLVLGAILGLYLPDLWVRLRTQRRQQEIRDGFPDVLDLMVVCVEAGLGLDQAINRVGKEISTSYPIISEEFELLSIELRLGIPREEAMRNFNQRINLGEIHQLTTLIIQADKYGSSITRALRVHSDSMRKKRHFRAEELAAKLPVKLAFPLIFFIFPSLFIVLLGPAVINLTEVVLPAMGGNK